jgi:hypothetical protein
LTRARLSCGPDPATAPPASTGSRARDRAQQRRISIATASRRAGDLAEQQARWTDYNIDYVQHDLLQAIPSTEELAYIVAEYSRTTAR